MPYKKGGEAYKRSLERKKAKRRIARLQKEVDATRSEKERYFYKQQIKTLRKQITETYEYNPLTHKATGYSKEDLRIAARNLSRTNVASQIGTSSQSRKNFITQQELNTAKSYGSGLSIGEFTREEVSIFYRATQEAWQNLPSDVNRNQAILEYYGKTDLREFVHDVLAMNERAVSVAHSEIYEVLDETGLVPDESEQDRAWSAEYLSYVVSPDMYEAMKSYITRPE